MCMKSMPTSIRCTILRGGTSKGVYLKESDLPADAELRDRIILAMFGSPDKRQIDGLGGADPLTSKVCIIGPPPQDEVCAPGAQLSYTFGQVGIDEPMVDYRGLCGNLTAGVGASSRAISRDAAKAPLPVLISITSESRPADNFLERIEAVIRGTDSTVAVTSRIA